MVRLSFPRTDGNAMVASLNDFAKRYLSRETAIRALYYTDMSLCMF